MQELIEIHDTKVIPFSDIVAAIKTMKYASAERVMFEMLILTGCRVSELDNMLRKNIHGSRIYWALGKNQKTMRSELLSDQFIKELQSYWKSNRLWGEHVFGISHESFRRYFHASVRPVLGFKWMQKIHDYSADSLTGWKFRYQLKHLRKDFQTLEFARQLKKWNDGT